MKKCLLVWQIPIIEGEYYNPIMYAVYIRKAKKFASVLNKYFQEQNRDWECVFIVVQLSRQKSKVFIMN